MFGNMTIKKKQAILLAGFFLSLLAAVVLTLVKLGDVKAAFAQYNQVGVQMETNVLKIGKEVNYVSRLTRSIMLGDNYDKNMKALDESSGAIDGFFSNARAAAEKIGSADSRGRFLQLIEASRTDTRAFIDDGIGRMRALKDTDPAARNAAWAGYHSAATPLANKSRESFKQLSDLSTEFMGSTHSSAAASIDRLFTWLPAMAGVAIVLMAWLSYVVVSDLLRRLGGEPAQVAEVVKRIAAGDLNSPIEAAPGDTSSLLAAVKTMQNDLRETIRKVSVSAAGLHGVSEQVTQVIDGLASTSSSQREAATEVASAMDEMTRNVRQVSTNSTDSWEVAREAGNLSESGGKIVLETHAEMNRIADTVARSSSSIAELGKHSEKISAVASAIREIADQTNLLALNAAIEAARAGEQGRGFAVVADEVRKLAERTTKSTEEIGVIIGSILAGTDHAVTCMKDVTSLVDQGVAMIDRAGESMRQISGGSSRVINSVSEIKSALSSQETAATHVSSRVESIARMAADNHASVQEIALATRKLKDLADSLYGSMHQFKV